LTTRNEPCDREKAFFEKVFYAAKHNILIEKAPAENSRRFILYSKNQKLEKWKLFPGKSTCIFFRRPI